MWTSRLPEFHKLSLNERVDVVKQWAELSEAEACQLRQMGLQNDVACSMIENVVGIFALPLGIAANLIVNGREYLVPMVVEEASVVAAASYGAKLARPRGGFTATAGDSVVIGQVQVLNCPEPLLAEREVLANRNEILLAANQALGRMVARGGGAFDVETRILDGPAIPQLIVHILVNTCNAMGANAVNTSVEAVAPLLEKLTHGQVNLRILSNLADRRIVRAECRIPTGILGDDGRALAGRIEAASDFAVADTYRAATHNKGIMNAVDAICLATGNDWRAVEAGAHAYAARGDRYLPLSLWSLHGDELVGKIELPLAVGVVGGATQSHPVARIAMKMLGVQSSNELAEIIASLGLAENLASLKALASEGIQRGHMRLHAGQITLAAEASPSGLTTEPK